MLGKEETKGLRHWHPLPQGGGHGKGIAPGDTRILRERGRPKRVSSLEGTAGEMTISGGVSNLDAPPLTVYRIFSIEMINPSPYPTRGQRSDYHKLVGVKL